MTSDHVAHCSNFEPNRAYFSVFATVVMNNQIKIISFFYSAIRSSNRVSSHSKIEKNDAELVIVSSATCRASPLRDTICSDWKVWRARLGQ